MHWGVVLYWLRILVVVINVGPPLLALIVEYIELALFKLRRWRRLQRRILWVDAAGTFEIRMPLDCAETISVRPGPCDPTTLPNSHLAMVAERAMVNLGGWDPDQWHGELSQTALSGQRILIGLNEDRFYLRIAHEVQVDPRTGKATYKVAGRRGGFDFVDLHEALFYALWECHGMRGEEIAVAL